MRVMHLRLTSSKVGKRVVDELPAVIRLGDVRRQDEDAWRAERRSVVGDLLEARLPSRHQSQVGSSLGILISQVLQHKFISTFIKLPTELSKSIYKLRRQGEVYTVYLAYAG